MSKRFALLFIILTFILLLSACSGQSVPEVSTYIVTSETEEYETVEYVLPSLDEMSPPKTDPAVPVKVDKNFSDMGTRTFPLISAKDSYMPDTEAKYVFAKGDRQYFYYSENSIVVMFPKSNGEFYSVYYSDGGALSFLCTDSKSWYFDENGEVYCIAHTYSDDFGTLVYTFYDSDGNRIAVRNSANYYNAELELMSPEEQLKLHNRLGAVIELISDGR